MKESDIEKYLHKEIEKIGGTTRKWVSPGRVGVPDRIVFLSNPPFFVETKVIDGVLSGPQRREIRRLRKKKAIVYVCVSFYGVNRLIKRIKRIHVTSK